jgi:hypothetical protein
MNSRRSAASKAALFLALVMGMSLLLSCGGGSNSNNTTPPPVVVEVSVSPTTATVVVSGTQQFTATVTGTSNTSVTWTLSGGAGQDLGSISSTGLYTAPAVVPSPKTVTVTATSVADTTKFASAAVTVSATPINNTVSMQVSVEPDLGGAGSFINMPFVDVTICEPGSTTNCQTISNVEVDTGSEGLRLLSSAVTLNLPPVTDNSSNQLQECVQFADGSYIWGPISTADIQMADEKASSVPVQLIPNPAPFTAPSACSSGGTAPSLSTLADLGANGIIGLGVFQQDCGAYCANSTPLQYDPYYLCPSSTCVQAITPTNFQLQNPVWMFPQDNNGFLIALPSIANTGAVSVTGTITFGIGTQANNGLGSATIYTIDNSGGGTTGDFATTFGSTTYGYGGVANSDSYIDSGSNGLYILSSATLGQGMADCTDANYTGFYCPGTSSALNAITYTATNKGVNGTSGAVNFTIGNTTYLDTFNGSSNWAFDDLGGPNPLVFDYGLPFFFGKTIYIGIENQTVGSTQGPLWAY